MELAGKVVLLTGARRIGADIAVAVAGRGADVAIGYNRSADEAAAVAESVRAAGRRALVVQADVADAAACAAMVERVADDLGRLDVLVNMASLYRSVPFDETDAGAWDRQMAIDLRGAYLVSRAAVPHMRRAGGGRIINFSDWIAASGRPRYKGYVAYYVAKAGVKALTEVLALELAADAILVNAIAPGPVLAPPGSSKDEIEAVRRSTPLGRWGGTAEIVQAALALVETDFITGETIRVDGGRHLY